MAEEDPNLEWVGPDYIRQFYAPIASHGILLYIL